MFRAGVTTVAGGEVSQPGALWKTASPAQRHQLPSTTPVTSRSHPREATDTNEVYEVIFRSLKL